MSLTANTRSNRWEENFSWTRRTSCLQSRNHFFLGSRYQNESNSHQLEENFSWTRRTSCLQSRNHLFLGSGCVNESNRHQLARIGEKKIFYELEVHHLYKVGITCFWAQVAKMSLTAISSLESGRRKFFMNSTYMMCRKLKSNVFGPRRPKWV